MRLDFDNLPSDMVLLDSLVRDMAAVAEHRDDQIGGTSNDHQTAPADAVRPRSERLDPDQFAPLEDRDSDIGRAEARGLKGAVAIAGKRPRRKPLPDHLPHEEIVINVANDACPCCGGVLHVYNTRPVIDPLFVSGAEIYGRRVVGVVLRGRDQDGAAGLRMIHNRDGLALVQDAVEASEPEMPAAAFALDDPEVMPIKQPSRRVFQFGNGRRLIGDQRLVAAGPVSAPGESITSGFTVSAQIVPTIGKGL
jgi:hypothetical protein